MPCGEESVTCPATLELERGASCRLGWGWFCVAACTEVAHVAEATSDSCCVWARCPGWLGGSGMEVPMVREPAGCSGDLSPPHLALLSRCLLGVFSWAASRGCHSDKAGIIFSSRGGCELLNYLRKGHCFLLTFSWFLPSGSSKTPLRQAHERLVTAVDVCRAFWMSSALDCNPV